MSDRLAVFRQGRIEQAGTPAEVYEKPATPFVADFVGISNLVEGPAAAPIAGSPDPFTIRPEKIRIQAPGSPVAAGSCTARGRIHDVVYLGSHTRFLVEIDGGTTLTVIEQNLDAVAVDVHAARGRQVLLAWPRAQNRPVRERG